MVKINSDLDKIENLEKLREEKLKKEKELLEIEFQKKEEIKDVEKKLEEAVASFAEEPSRTESTAEIAAEPSRETPQEDDDELERRVLRERIREEEQRRVEEEGGQQYRVNLEDISNLPDTYDRVRRELEAGRADSPIVDQAREMVYHLNNRESAYVSREVRERVWREGDQGDYINRLNSLFDLFESQASPTKERLYK